MEKVNDAKRVLLHLRKGGPNGEWTEEGFLVKRTTVRGEQRAVFDRKFSIGDTKFYLYGTLIGKTGRISMYTYENERVPARRVLDMQA